MALDLADYADWMRREITPLGTTLFTDVTDDDLTSYMTDAFWEARLDGFFAGYESDDTGVITPVSGTTDLALDAVALIVVYAGIRILRNRILNTQTTFRAKAGPVEFEQQTSANMLSEMLRQLKDTKVRILENDGGMGQLPTLVFDWLEARPEAYRIGYNNPALGR
jgi:hypothetical protein